MTCDSPQLRLEPRTTPCRLEAAFPEIRRIPTPGDPTRPGTPLPTWRSWNGSTVRSRPPRRSPARPTSPALLATIYITPGTLRLTSPRVETLEQAEEKLARMLGAAVRPLERVAAPLPLPFLDADVWTTRLPEGLDRELSHRLRARPWKPTTRTNGSTGPARDSTGFRPWPRRQAARRGDTLARAKLEGVIGLREQLGSRSSAVLMYQGYPFDRLRHRLGLVLSEPDSVDPLDLSCALLPELQELIPEELDDARLAEAFKSAAGFRDDALTTRFAVELHRRKPSALHQVDLTMVYAPLVRQAMQRSNPAEALDWLDQARSAGDRCEPEILRYLACRDPLADRPARRGGPHLCRSRRLRLLRPASRPRRRRDLPGQRPPRPGPDLPQAHRDLARTARVTGVEDLANRHLKALA